MEKTIYRFKFEHDVDMKEVEETAALAVVAASALHGEPAVRLSWSYAASHEKKTLVAAHHDEIGMDVTRMFVGFCSHEYGNKSFKTEMVSPATEHDTGEIYREGMVPHA